MSAYDRADTIFGGLLPGGVRPGLYTPFSYLTGNVDPDTGAARPLGVSFLERFQDTANQVDQEFGGYLPGGTEPQPLVQFLNPPTSSTASPGPGPQPTAPQGGLGNNLVLAGALLLGGLILGRRSQ